MRVGISGKGGVGKTTIAAVLARTLARRGHRVVAIDCDSDPHLALSLGMGEPEWARQRPLLEQPGSVRLLPKGLAPSQVLAEYGHTAPNDVALILGARVEKAGSG